MQGPRLEIIPFYRHNKKGMDVVISSDQATAGDYCAAMEQYILDGGYQRLRSADSSCAGCDTCCQERIPLTSIDALTMKDRIDPQMDWSDFFQKYAYVSVSGRVVDIALSHDSDEKCVFLDKSAKKCLYYRERPFVCRTYICAPGSPRMEKLREYITNSGEDELARIWLESGKKSGYIIHEAVDAAVKAEDWPVNAWTGKMGYSSIAIKDIVPPSFWEELKKR